MKDIKISFKIEYIFFVVSLILALIFQIYMISTEDSFNESLDFKPLEVNYSTYNYEVYNDLYITTNNDPQILFNQIDQNIQAIKIKFHVPLKQAIDIKIYYAKDDNPLLEQNSVYYQAKVNQQYAIIKIPYDHYSCIRIDIGSKEGEMFNLLGIDILNKKINFLDTVIGRTNLSSTLVLTSIIFLLFYFLRYKERYNTKREKIMEIIFTIFCFTMFTLWAIVQPYDSCPDEYMRYDIIKYLFEYNKLPHGGDPIIRNEIWGFSYGFVPYLSGIISAIFMKVSSIFTMNEETLIIAARMAVVMFGTITVHYIIKIANKCFSRYYKWLFISLICCLPQFVFLGSYMNNDMIALMSVAMIIYYWIEGHEKRWDTKSSVGLAISVSICMLSYYNAYPFILFSIIYFIYSNIRLKQDKKVIIRKFLFIASIVFILCGWWFIRNAILYNGDFLGLKTMNEYSEIYGREDIQISNRNTPFSQGISVADMLFKMNWLKLSFISFIGVFGYMTIFLPSFIYDVYNSIIVIGGICFLVNLIRNKYTEKNIMYICMIISSILVICLSIYNSYTSGFQAQGRYIITCLIPLAMFVTIGIKQLIEKINSQFNKNFELIVLSINIICLVASVLCFRYIIMPIY